jgi:hypothetical protein
VNIKRTWESIRISELQDFQEQKVGYLIYKTDGLETVRYCMFTLYSEELLNVPGVDVGGEEVKSLTNYMELSPS